MLHTSEAHLPDLLDLRSKGIRGLWFSVLELEYSVACGSYAAAHPIGVDIRRVASTFGSAVTLLLDSATIVPVYADPLIRVASLPLGAQALSLPRLIW